MVLLKEVTVEERRAICYKVNPEDKKEIVKEVLGANPLVCQMRIK